jgi:hypothetical protein
MGRTANDKSLPELRTASTPADTKCQMEDPMQKFVPVLKALLAGCIGFLALIVILNLAFGSVDGAVRMTVPLLFGLYAFLFIGRANWAQTKCPSCATQQPLWRQPTSFRQLLRGGWTCPDCGTEMDRHGNAINGKPTAR